MIMMHALALSQMQAAVTCSLISSLYSCVAYAPLKAWSGCLVVLLKVVLMLADGLMGGDAGTGLAADTCHAAQICLPWMGTS